MKPRSVYFIITIFLAFIALKGCESKKKYEDKEKCPRVKSIRNFILEDLLGKWYVVEYYASSEEALSYRCMRAEFSARDPDEITMNFTYSFTDDPLNEILLGNITWRIPNLNSPSHWIHSEDTYEGVYNTYVLDSDYKSWALLLHCAEKAKVPRYLSSFIMSRKPSLGMNEKAYLRDKLPRYDVDVAYLFEMSQENCDENNNEELFGNGFNSPSLIANGNNKRKSSSRRHPMKHVHKVE